MPLIQLDRHKHLFRDEASYHRFLKILQNALRGGDMSMILAETEEEEFLFTVISSDDTKKVLCDRILDRLSATPALVDELRERLENDEIVD